MMYILINTILTISLEEIAKIYGMMCLFCLPVALAAIVYIYKRHPDTMAKINNMLDKIVEGEKETKEQIKEKKEQDKTPEEREKAINDELGIPTMVLKVGDRYRCHLSDKDRKDIRCAEYHWATDNKFIGTIHEMKGLYEAKKAGTGYIECGPQNIRIYHVIIKPNNTEWIGYLPINDLLNSVHISKIKTRLNDWKPVREDESKKIIEIKHKDYSITYQTDEKGNVRKILIKLKNQEQIKEHIRCNIEEYMEQLQIKNNGSMTEYWIHRCGIDADFPDSIDYVAFMKNSKNGQLYLAAGECWRAGANKSEMSDNPEMIERSFSDLLDKKDIPDKIGIQKTKSNDKTT